MGIFRKAVHAGVVAAAVACIALASGCSKKDVNRQVVATVNGETITVLDLRESMGAPTGIFSFTGMPQEEKRKAVDRLVLVYLVAQSGEELGLGKTPEYGAKLRENEIGVQVDALLRKEFREKLKLDDAEVRAEAAKIRGEQAELSEQEAAGRASRSIVKRQVRKIQNDLIETARKETGASVDNAALDRIGKGDELPDSVILGSAGDDKVLYGDIRRKIGERPFPQRPGLSGSGPIPPALVERVLEQELTLRSLKAYSKKRGVESSEGYRTARRNMERSVIANMVFDNVTGNTPEVTDAEVEADYASRLKMMEEGVAKAEADARAQADGAAKAEAAARAKWDEAKKAGAGNAEEAKAQWEEAARAKTAALDQVEQTSKAKARTKAPPIDKVREQLRNALRNQKRRALFEEFIEGLRKKGKVTVDEEVLKKV